MEEENLILKAYREDKAPNTINIYLKSHTYGYEIYRIVLTLIDKIFKFNLDSSEIEDEKVRDFFKQMAEDYIGFYKKK